MISISRLKSLPTDFFRLLLTSFVLTIIILIERYYFPFDVSDYSFYVFFVEIILMICCIVFFIRLTLYCYFNFKSIKYFIVISFIISILTVLIFYRFTIYEMALGYKDRFRIYQEQYEYIAKIITDKELEVHKTNGDWEIIELPLKYKYLSRGGFVWVDKSYDKTTIFFIGSCGFLADHPNGYVYISDGGVPGNKIFDNTFEDAKKITDGWFWREAY